ncbi:MAG: hypothetical protein ACI9SC_003066 [Gammaproteobacteria bacterium]|jgi:hypothetical protein
MKQTEQIFLLQECRQIMTKRLRTTITGMLNEIDETLLNMAQTRTGDLEESACYDAVREIRLKRVEIKTRFERRFINLFENEIKMGRSTSRSEPRRDDTTQRRNLINRSSSNELLALESSLDGLRKNCGQTLLALDKKFSLLMDTPIKVNPMQPAFIFEAFREACADIKSGDEVRLMIFNTFERHIADELQSIYEDINNILEARNESSQDTTEFDYNMSNTYAQENDTVMLRYEVISRIENRLEGHDVPDFVRVFLLKHWRLFLESIYTKYSENSIAWNAARQTMDDLIWSVSKPTSLYDRQRQIQLLPSLLFRLLNGMKVILMDESDSERFLKELKEHQLKALASNVGPLLEISTDQDRKGGVDSHKETQH